VLAWEERMREWFEQGVSRLCPRDFAGSGGFSRWKGTGHVKGKSQGDRMTRGQVSVRSDKFIWTCEGLQESGTENLYFIKNPNTLLRKN
jgi:hypothetical protein